MREIKFRCWNKKAKEWFFYDEEVWSLYPEILLVRDFGVNGNTIERKDVELMEFTGFLDKKRKEIWEGDIVASPTAINQLVEWDEERGMWSVDGHEHPTGQLSHWAQESVVIGNKWEHLELLTKQ